MSTDLYRTYATPLRIEPVGTRRIGRGLLCVYGCATLVVALLPLPLNVRCLLELGLLLSLAWQWRCHVSRTSPRCVQAMTWQEGRACRVRLRNGAEQDVILGNSAFVQPWLVIIHFHGRHRRRHYLLLLPDMLDRNTYRRLRVRLRMELPRI